MANIFRNYKVEVNLTIDQEKKLQRMIGSLRVLKNMYIVAAMDYYEINGSILEPDIYLGWLYSALDSDPNNVYHYLRNETTKSSREIAIKHSNRAYQRAATKVSNKPTLYRRGDQKVKYHFDRNSSPKTYVSQTHVRVPYIGLVELKQHGYLPLYNVEGATNETLYIDWSLSCKGDRYYISGVVMHRSERRDKIVATQTSQPIGVDLGIKVFATTSNGLYYPNVNNSQEMQRMSKRLSKLMVRYERMFADYEIRRSVDPYATRRNLDKLQLKIQNVHRHIYSYRMSYINRVVHNMVKDRPTYIAIEDLRPKEMMSSSESMSRNVNAAWFYTFKRRLQEKCHEQRIELRQVDRWYPSSKTCSGCGNIKTTLTLDDRDYCCEVCGHMLDRDLNASINICKTDQYVVI